MDEHGLSRAWSNSERFTTASPLLALQPYGSILNKILRAIESFPKRLKSVRAIVFAFFLDRSVPKAAYRGAETLTASFRTRRDFVTACSKISPSASNVL